MNLTGNRYHAVLPDNLTYRGPHEITLKAKDDGHFRTPSLRNVADTGLWFQDGSAHTLGEAVARHRIALSDAETDVRFAYLDALTDRTFIENVDLTSPDHPCGET